MSEWTVRPLSEFVCPDRQICYGIVQPGKEVSEGVPIIRVNNFRNRTVETADLLQVDPEIEAKFSRSRLRGGELLITLVGTMGLVAVAPSNVAGFNVARAVGVIPLHKNTDQRWIEYVLRSKAAQEYIRIHANTTVQATFNLRDLANLPTG